MRKTLTTRVDIVSVQPEVFLRLCPAAIGLPDDSILPLYKPDALLPDCPLDNLHLAGALSANEGAGLAAYKVAQLLCMESMLEVRHEGEVQVLVNGWSEYKRQFGEYYHPAQTEPDVVLVMFFTDLPATPDSVATKLYWQQLARTDSGIHLIEFTQDNWHESLAAVLREYSD
jgi:hypothetical protein